MHSSESEPSPNPADSHPGNQSPESKAGDPKPDPALEATRLWLSVNDADCPNCGYGLRGCQGGTCPECGEPLALSLFDAARIRTQAKARMLARCAIAASVFGAAYLILFVYSVRSLVVLGSLPAYFLIWLGVGTLITLAMLSLGIRLIRTPLTMSAQRQRKIARGVVILTILLSLFLPWMLLLRQIIDLIRRLAALILNV